jgi:hypothetical protein
VYNQRPVRWKQWLQTANEMRDSHTPVQPNRANRKATVLVDEEGGLSVASEPGGLKNDECTRGRISSIRGSGYAKFSRMGKSLSIALKER